MSLPLELLRYSLTRLGEWTTPITIHRLNAALNYLEVGRWMRASNLSPQHRVGRREDLFAEVARRIGDQPALYLEFGVYRGDSLREWSRLLTNHASQLHGFDTFEGLPETWNLGAAKGHFAVDGKLPELNDPRVVLHQGLFSETLPTFALPPHEALVVSLDADLYSSTIYVLRALRQHLRAGSYLYFDEFSDRLHELRAFDEFVAEADMRFEVVGATRALSRVMFRRVDAGATAAGHPRLNRAV